MLYYDHPAQLSVSNLNGYASSYVLLTYWYESGYVMGNAGFAQDYHRSQYWFTRSRAVKLVHFLLITIIGHRSIDVNHDRFKPNSFNFITTNSNSDNTYGGHHHSGYSSTSHHFLLFYLFTPKSLTGFTLLLWPKSYLDPITWPRYLQNIPIENFLRPYTLFIRSKNHEVEWIAFRSVSTKRSPKELIFIFIFKLIIYTINKIQANSVRRDVSMPSASF